MVGTRGGRYISSRAQQAGYEIDERAQAVRHIGVKRGQALLAYAAALTAAGYQTIIDGLTVKYADDEARDNRGRWTSGGPTGEEDHTPAGAMLDTDSLYARLMKPDMGFTVQPVTGAEPTGAGHYAVSIYPKQGKEIKVGDLENPADLAKYVRGNMTLLRKPDHYLGGWHDPETHSLWLDVSVVTDSPEKAAKLAKDHNQLAYFDFGKMSSVRVDHAAKGGKRTGVTCHLTDMGDPVTGIVKLWEAVTGRTATDSQRAAVQEIL
jgi:hypothetical protein